ncbi:protein SULFUR DEFICIENCY-INDUCED 1-like isoform X1 [Nicotiana tomentosiformis]|uniref:protein SULFUR DEFICIENCY-INDUCED 1-like isoform X1 n=1 Tax=Nicotiana tomentosiformis TaxID=4098 RepID=UPI00051C20C6|nr:protein SULFUR DEFICIENCY-INDUCED 1-like isoform X1 [Nicotiana tomentosiformis]
MEMMKNKENKELFHVVHKVPSGDGPYVRAKHAQLVEKEPETAIVWFWKAINGGDRVDSALKDMCVVMKQLHRTEEAIEAIYSFRSLCSQQAQESLDNVLLDLLKKSGKVDEQIALLKQKLRQIYQGQVFNGKPTKTARSHGKKFQVSVSQETARVLGNLGWAYMQKGDFMAAEVIYKKAQMIDADSNKACNLAHCLIKQARYDEARNILEDVWRANYAGSDDPKTKNRVEELVLELDSRQPPPFLQNLPGLNLDDDFVNGLEQLINAWAPSKSRRLPIFEEISTFKNQLAC